MFSDPAASTLCKTSINICNVSFLQQWKCHWWYCGWQCHVDLYVTTTVTEEYTASIFMTEDGGSTFLWNAGTHIQVWTTSWPRKPLMTETSISLFSLFFCFNPLGPPASYSLLLTLKNWIFLGVIKTHCSSFSTLGGTSQKTHISILQWVSNPWSQCVAGQSRCSHLYRIHIQFMKCLLAII
jgi:hypothetical protein